MIIKDKTLKLDNCTISFSFLRGEDNSRVKINLKDKNSLIDFATVELNSDQFIQVLAGWMDVSCEEASFNSLDLIGKKQENSEFVFEIGKENYHNKQKTKIILEKNCPEGWAVFDSFSSYGSFFTKDNKYYAKSTIRRWV